MNMMRIEVPEYVANDFNKPLTNQYRDERAVKQSLDRVYRLISHALAGLENVQWEVNEGQYHSSLHEEAYGFHRVSDKFYIYCEERGRRDAIAVFKSPYSGADYFVWLVSGGKASIDWSLFLDMEN